MSLRLFHRIGHSTIEMRTLFVLLPFLCLSLLGRGLHSHVDENGVKVFTNFRVNRRDITPTSAPATDSAFRQSKYTSLFRASASRNRLDENLLKAIASVESSFNPRAISHKGCIGLMQLHPDTAKRFQVQNIFDPADNIEGGAKYLNFLMDFFHGELTQVLAAYNAGENAVIRHKGIPPYRETQDYVRKVSAMYDSLNTAPISTKQFFPKRLYRVLLPNGNILFTDASSPNLPSVGAK